MVIRKRNRNIRTFSSAATSVFDNSDVISQISCIDTVLGENIGDSQLPKLEEENAECQNKMLDDKSTLGSDLEDIFDLKLSGISSSSSLSWSDDYDSEVIKKVQSELEKVDGYFQGLDVQPPYDKNEIKEWQHFFPHLTILGYNTPSNSPENSEISSDEEFYLNNNKKYITLSSQIRNRGRNEKHMQRLLHQKGQILPYKPKSLDIDKYLKISEIKSPYLNRKQENSQPIVTVNNFNLNETSECISLPFITATPMKTQRREPRHHQKSVSKLILPPITNSMRSVSATPRQSSSKSMFVCLNFEKDVKAKEAQMELKSDLMKLFEHIPVSNR